MSSSVLSQPDATTLLARLRARDERAFAQLVERYHGSHRRVARGPVRDARGRRRRAARFQGERDRYRSAVHACRPADLRWWLAEEL